MMENRIRMPCVIDEFTRRAWRSKSPSVLPASHPLQLLRWPRTLWSKSSIQLAFKRKTTGGLYDSELTGVFGSDAESQLADTKVCARKGKA